MSDARASVHELSSRIAQIQGVSEALQEAYVRRLARHYAQWERVIKGSLAEDSARPGTSIGTLELLEAIVAFEDAAHRWAIYPSDQRSAVMDQVSERIGIQRSEADSIWRWWDTAGREVALDD